MAIARSVLPVPASPRTIIELPAAIALQILLNESLSLKFTLLLPPGLFDCGVGLEASGRSLLDETLG